MNALTQKLSVIAYYLSKYNNDAITRLGYSTQQKALSELSALFGHANSYLKMRRDEFDVVTGSHRKGFRNRKPAVSVSNLALLLDQYTYEELSVMVSDLIQQRHHEVKGGNSAAPTLAICDEVSLEDLMNGYCSDAHLKEETRKSYRRIYNAQSLEKLKKHYNYKCQICGIAAGTEFGTPIAEIHHIIPFSETQDNSLTNLVVLCPNHHRLLHKANAVFIPHSLHFLLSNHMIIPLTLNDHL